MAQEEGRSRKRVGDGAGRLTRRPHACGTFTCCIAALLPCSQAAASGSLSAGSTSRPPQTQPSQRQQAARAAGSGRRRSGGGGGAHPAPHSATTPARWRTAGAQRTCGADGRGARWAGRVSASTDRPRLLPLHSLQLRGGQREDEAHADLLEEVRRGLGHRDRPLEQQ